MRPQPSGFTLIELLLVVTIMSVLAAGVVASLGGGRSGRHAVRAAAQDVAAAIQFAASEARLRGVRVRVVFVDEGHAIRVEVMDETTRDFRPAEGTPGTVRKLSGGVRVARVAPADGAAAWRNTGSVDFGPGGPAFAGRIEVQGPDRTVRSVTVRPETGETNVEPAETPATLADTPAR